MSRSNELKDLTCDSNVNPFADEYITLTSTKCTIGTPGESLTMVGDQTLHLLNNLDSALVRCCRAVCPEDSETKDAECIIHAPTGRCFQLTATECDPTVGPPQPPIKLCGDQTLYYQGNLETQLVATCGNLCLSAADPSKAQCTVNLIDA